MYAGRECRIPGSKTKTSAHNKANSKNFVFSVISFAPLLPNPIRQ